MLARPEIGPGLVKARAEAMAIAGDAVLGSFGNRRDLDRVFGRGPPRNLCEMPRWRANFKREGDLDLELRAAHSGADGDPEQARARVAHGLQCRRHLRRSFAGKRTLRRRRHSGSPTAPTAQRRTLGRDVQLARVWWTSSPSTALELATAVAPAPSTIGEVEHRIREAARRLGIPLAEHDITLERARAAWLGSTAGSNSPSVAASFSSSTGASSSCGRSNHGSTSAAPTPRSNSRSPSALPRAAVACRTLKVS